MDETLSMLLVVGGIVAIFLVAFLAIRGIVDRRRELFVRRLQAAGNANESILVEQYEQVLRTHSSSRNKRSPATKLDQSFIRMVERTGLALHPDQALGIVCLVGVVIAATLYLWRGELWLVMVGLIVGMAMPLGILYYLQGRWRWQVQTQLPDAFFLLARSLRAGLSLEQALELAGKEGLEPIASEWRRASEKINLGLAVPAALQSVGKRLQLMDFNVFVSVVALHRATGGNLALLMDRLAQSTRDRNQYHGYFRSATALGRITAVAIGAAVPLIFVGYAIFEPTYAARFFESAAGLTSLAVAFCLELVGGIWLYYLLKMEY